MFMDEISDDIRHLTDATLAGAACHASSIAVQHMCGRLLHDVTVRMRSDVTPDVVVQLQAVSIAKSSLQVFLVSLVFVFTTNQP